MNIFIKVTLIGMLFFTLKCLSQVNQFTGDAVQGIKLASLGGVDVALNYNSNVRTIAFASNKDAQSGWVGLGWSLNLGTITGSINNSIDTTDDIYYLLGPDGSSELIHYSGNEYRMKDYRYWKIYRSVNSSGLIVGWKIIKDDGTIVRYGNIDTSTNSFSLSYSPTNATRMNIAFGGIVSSPLNNYYSDTANTVKIIPYQWDISDIEYVNGTHTRIIYQQEYSRLASGNVRTPILYTRESHPKYIIDRSGQYLQFNLATLTSSEYTVPSDSLHQYIYDTKYLSQLSIRSKDSTVLRQIDLEYFIGTIPGSNFNKRYLTSITESDTKGFSFPSRSFYYVGVNGESNGPNYGALKKVKNPEGGVLEYTYTFKILPINLDYVRNYPVNNSSPNELENDIKTFGTVGSDYAVVKLEDGKLDVIRWTATGWGTDTAFPISGSVLNYKVGGDYIAVKENVTNIKIVKRFEDKWKVYNVSPDTIGSNMEILGIGNNYVVISHNQKVNGSDSLVAVTVCTINNNNISYYKLGHFRITKNVEILVTCQANYLFIQWPIYGVLPTISYANDLYMRNNGIWQNGYLADEFIIQKNYIPRTNTSSDYFVDLFVGYQPKWNGKLFSYPTEDIFNYNDSVYTQPSYFVINEGQYYYIHYWKADSLGSPVSVYKTDTLNKIFNSNKPPFPEAKIAIGNDFIAVGWYENTTGKLWITNYKNGSWVPGQLFTYEGRKIDPKIVGNNLVVSIDSLSPNYRSTHKLKIMTYENDWWAEGQELINLSFTTSWYLINTQPSNDIIVDLVELSQADNQKSMYLYRKGFGENSNYNYYKGNQSGVFVVSSLKLSNGIGNNLISKYEYEQGTYTDALMAARFNRVTYYPPGNSGKVETYYYNDLNTSSGAYDFIDDVKFTRLDGIAYRTKSYDSSGIVVGESKSYWSVVWIGDSTFGITQKRLDSTESLIDGVTSFKKNFYNASNGLIWKTVDSLINVKSDKGNNQSIVTEIQYAFEGHKAAMNSAGKNMLVYPFESKVYEKNINNSISLVSSKRTFYSDSSLYVTSQKIYDSTQWITTDSIITRNNYGNVIESRNIDGVVTTTKWGYNNQLPIGTIVNAADSETALEPCEEFRFLGSYGLLSNKLSMLDNNHSVQFAKSSTGVSGYAQKVVTSQTTGSGSGLSVDMGTMDATTNYFIEFDYLVTQGSLQVFTSNGVIQSTYVKETSPKWKHAKVLWNLGGSTSNMKVYFRNAFDGDMYWTASTFYLDNVRVYPVDAMCTSFSYDPVTLKLNSTTDINGVTSVSVSDGFGRSTHIKR